MVVPSYLSTNQCVVPMGPTQPITIVNTFVCGSGDGPPVHVRSHPGSVCSPACQPPHNPRQCKTPVLGDVCVYGEGEGRHNLIRLGHGMGRAIWLKR